MRWTTPIRIAVLQWWPILFGTGKVDNADTQRNTQKFIEEFEQSLVSFYLKLSHINECITNKIVHIFKFE